MKWRCYNRYLWFEIERNLSPPDAFWDLLRLKSVCGAPDPAGGALCLVRFEVKITPFLAVALIRFWS